MKSKRALSVRKKVFYSVLKVWTKHIRCAIIHFQWRTIALYGLVVQLVRTPPCHGGGHGFESRSGRLFYALWFSMVCKIFGVLAQLGEHLPYKQGVTGSSPVGPIFYRSGFADVAQLAEQLICNQQVIGSSPIIGFILYRYFLDGFPSGQRGQTVNLLSVTSVVRIHPHPLQTSMTHILPRGGAVWKLVGLITRRSEVQILPPLLCPDSSVGRAED